MHLYDLAAATMVGRSIVQWHVQADKQARSHVYHGMPEHSGAGSSRARAPWQQLAFEIVAHKPRDARLSAGASASRR